MYKNTKSEKNIKSRCSVCNFPIIVDTAGNGGKCANCGWVENAASKELPHMMSPIIISLDKAKRLYREGKSLVPDFYDFIEACKQYGEMQFYYKEKRYGVSAPKKNVIFFLWDTQNPQFFEFQSIEEFSQKATIDGVLLKNLWADIENAYFLQ